MQVWLLDYDTFIKVNGLKEVTDPIMFNTGNVPSPEGLFSTEIFGTSSRERRDTFAYIDLKDHYLNPKAYIALKRLNRNFEAVIYGTKKFIIKNGVLEEDENGNTGINWLYDNWEKIKFKKNDSNQRNERIDLLTNNPKNIIFTTKFLVAPAFFRDVNIQSTDSHPKVPEINNLYSKLIRNTKTIQESSTMDFIIQSLKGKNQDLIIEIYNLLKDKIQGKRGYIRQFLMGKSVDYSSRVVITAVPYTSNTVYDQDINFYHTGIPLSHVCSEFTPFIIHWLKNWFKNNIENQASSFLYKENVNDAPILIKLKNPQSVFNEDYIEKHLDHFISNPYTRFDTIEVPVDDASAEKIGKKTITCRFEGMTLSSENINTVSRDNYKPNVHRALTWTDLLYRAAVDVTADKHIWITRYPVTDYLGTFTSRITVISTRKTQPMIVNGILYKKYPVIDLDAKDTDMDAIFRDTIAMSALYLPAIGGDHDGDQITCKSVFSQESNEECEKIITSKSNLLSVKGTAIRGIGNEGVQTLYSMTRFR